MRIEMNSGGLAGMFTIKAFQSDFGKLIKNSESVASSFQAIRKSIYNMNGGIGTLQDALDDINRRIYTEEKKIESLKLIETQSEQFLKNVSTIDKKVENAVKKNKDEFYKTNPWAKPPQPQREKKWYERVKEWIFGKSQTFIKSLSNAIGYIKGSIYKIKEAIKNFKLFDFVGKLLHSEKTQSAISWIMGGLYKIKFYDLIKIASFLGTKLALIERKYPMLYLMCPAIGKFALATPNFYSLVLGADMDNEGIYHMRPNCLQQYGQYSTGYDDVFKATLNKATENNLTVSVNQSSIFWADLNQNGIKDKGEEFIIWSWKGDYMNLGAGAETGIYQVDRERSQVDENGNYIIGRDGEYAYIYAEVNRDFSAKMTLDVFYKGERISEKPYSPKEKQWWITSFKPMLQGVKSEELRSVTTIDFSSYGEYADIMYNAFKEQSSKGLTNKGTITANDATYVVTIDWE